MTLEDDPERAAIVAAHQAAKEEIGRLVRHAEYLRQINSNKAFRLERRSRWMTIATVAVAAAITFVGFTGTSKLREQLGSVLCWSQQAIDLTYNSLVLMVLLLTIISLIYRLPERAALHQSAIQVLTEFIRAHSAVHNAAILGATTLGLAESKEAEKRYLAVTSSLPPSTDKEFLKAKRDYAKKKAKSKSVPVVEKASGWCARFRRLKQAW